MKPVLLWSDALLFLLLALIVAGGRWSRRQEHLKEAWRKVGASGTAMAAATVLAAFLAIGVLDSLHYRERLPDAGKGQPAYSNEVLSALDGLLLPVKSRTEKTYSAPLATHLFATDRYTTVLRLTLLNTFVVGFYFLPFHVLRIEGRARTYVALTFANNLATLLVKLLFVVGLGMGVLGVALGDLLVAVGLALVLAPRYAARIRPVFSARQLRACLAFGLPRVPHSFAHQGLRWG